MIHERLKAGCYYARHDKNLDTRIVRKIVKIEHDWKGVPDGALPRQAYIYWENMGVMGRGSGSCTPQTFARWAQEDVTNEFRRRKQEGTA